MTDSPGDNTPQEIVVEALTPGPIGIALIKFYEQCRLKAYMPTSKDRPTIGWGMTTIKGRPVKMGMTITQEEADALFSDELRRRARLVAALVAGSPTTQPQFDALVSFAYNVGEGEGGLQTSSLLRHHRAGNYLAASHQFSLWIYQAGVRLPGLIKRRALEASLYMTPPDWRPSWYLPDGTIQPPRI